MRTILISSLGVALLSAVPGCKHDGGNSMGSMNSGTDNSMSASSPATMPSATMYTCPMHPEVVAAAPGKCPKCGMDLIPKK